MGTAFFIPFFTAGLFNSLDSFDIFKLLSFYEITKNTFTICGKGVCIQTFTNGNIGKGLANNLHCQ